MKEGIYMKCPYCGEELPEEYVYVPQENAECNTVEDAALDDKETANAETTDDTVENDTPNIDETSESAENDAQPSAESKEIPIPVYMPELENGKSFNFHSRTVRIAAAAIAVAIIGGVSALGISLHGRSELRDRLSGTWEAANSSLPAASFFSGTTITFEDDSLTYSESLGMIEINSQTVRYSIVSSDTIKINDAKYKIEFKGTNSMTITPGFSGSSSETWLKENTDADHDYESDQSESVL